MIVEQVSKDFWRLTVGHGCRQLVFFSTVSGEEVTSKWNRYVRDLDFDKYRVTTLASMAVTGALRFKGL
jgi:hypothetical protein